MTFEIVIIILLLLIILFLGFVIFKFNKTVNELEKENSEQDQIIFKLESEAETILDILPLIEQYPKNTHGASELGRLYNYILETTSLVIVKRPVS